VNNVANRLDFGLFGEACQLLRTVRWCPSQSDRPLRASLSLPRQRSDPSSPSPDPLDKISIPVRSKVCKCLPTFLLQEVGDVLLCLLLRADLFLDFVDLGIELGGGVRSWLAGTRGVLVMWPACRLFLGAGARAHSCDGPPTWKSPHRQPRRVQSACAGCP